MAKNFPKFIRNVKLQTQETQRTISRIKTKHMSTHTLRQMAENQRQKILKVTRVGKTPYLQSERIGVTKIKALSKVKGDG